MKKHLRTVLLASTALSFLLVTPAHAADTSTAEAIKALQAQVNALQKQLVDIQAKEKVAQQTPVASAPAAPAESSKKEILPGVTVKFGGYAAVEGVYRGHNQSAGSGSNLNTSIAYANGNNANIDEFHLTSNATRFSMLAEGKVDKDMSLAAYFEGDFMGGSTSSAASVESNSYTPRMRHAYATIDRNDWGLHVLAGQSWSLTSLFKSGLTPRQEAGPIGIDSVGPAGYVYTRSPQIRIVKDFAGNKGHVGLSFEDSEVNMAGLACTSQSTAAGTCDSTHFARVTATSTGAGGLAGNQSLDYAPDVVAKVAYDTSIGHFEIFGLSRFFRDSVTVGSSYQNNYAVGLGGGVGAFIPVIAKKLDIQANLMGGRGVGRYSSGQMPDLAFSRSGDIKPIEELTAMLGVIGHPTPTWDLYLYSGVEKVMRQNSADGAYGYGSTAIDNSGCYYQTGTCSAQTESIWTITPGFWNTVYKGDYGSIKLGAQYAFTRKDAFSGLNDKQPHAYENVIMTSFRYSPF
ncbi:MAG: hypothetical protein PHD48_11540 [Alphaproteobacteria bacterium]|nr:hypothetical protein [Alphaproteobacteria bacterium]